MREIWLLEDLQVGHAVRPAYTTKSELGVVFRHRICIASTSTGARPPHPIFMKGHDRLRVSQSNQTLPLLFISKP
jgi:hypothetical protein